MKANFKVYYSEVGEIDLKDYGHDADVKFEDLTEEQKIEIWDHLREEVICSVDVETITDY